MSDLCQLESLPCLTTAFCKVCAPLDFAARTFAAIEHVRFHALVTCTVCHILLVEVLLFTLLFVIAEALIEVVLTFTLRRPLAETVEVVFRI